MTNRNDLEIRKVRYLKVIVLLRDNDELILIGDEAQRFLQCYQKYKRGGLERGVRVYREFIRFDRICSVKTKHNAKEEGNPLMCETINCLPYIPDCEIEPEIPDCESIPGLAVWGEVSWKWEPTTKTITLYCGYAGTVADAPWKVHADVRQIIFTDEVFLSGSMASLFGSLDKLVEIRGAELINTELVTDMWRTFMACTLLESVNVSTWDVSRVGRFNDMFWQTPNLKGVDLSGWRASKATNVSRMFQGCRLIETLDFSGFMLDEVANTNSVFAGMESLRKLTLGAESVFSDRAGLPEIIKEGYTGRWGGEMHGIIYESSLAFMRDYDGSAPDTYIAEKIL